MEVIAAIVQLVRKSFPGAEKLAQFFRRFFFFDSQLLTAYVSSVGALVNSNPRCQDPALLRTNLAVRDAIVIKFVSDSIDESDELYNALNNNALKGGGHHPLRLALHSINGNHITPDMRDQRLVIPAVDFKHDGTRSRNRHEFSLFVDILTTWINDVPPSPVAPSEEMVLPEEFAAECE